MATLKNPTSDLVAALTGQTLASTLLTTNSNLFAGRHHPTPMQECVYVSRQGSSVEPYLGGDASVFRDLVVVEVSGVPGERGHDLAESLTQAIAGYVHLLSVSGYVSVILQSSPEYGGDDEDGRPQFSFTVELTYTA